MAIDWSKLGEERIKDKNRFYLIISGDKDFTEHSFVAVEQNDKVVMLEAYQVVEGMTDRMLRTRVANGNEIMIRCGDNGGADSLATMYAEHKGYSLNRIIADWDANGNRAGYIRNENIFSSVGLKENKGGIIFWDGNDTYTRNLIYLGWEFGVPLRVFNYKLKRWLSKSEIEDVQDSERKVQLKYGRGF